MNNPQLTYSRSITIRPSETNLYGMLRTDATANYMEDIATIHATRLGVGLNALLAHDISWAMSKMRIQFHRRPLAGEVLKLATRPSAGQHNTYLREFLFTDTDGANCVTAMTWWVAFDLKTRKMTSLPDALNTFPQGEQPLQDSSITVPPIRRMPDPITGPRFTIRLSDIDQNNHVNNVRYVSFVEEAGLHYNGQATLQEIELVFRAESRYGDTISSISAIEKSTSPTAYSMLHSLQSDTGELLRGRTRWEIRTPSKPTYESLTL